MTHDPRMAAHLACLKLNSRLLVNCFRDVGAEAALHRPTPRNNNMAFLGAHLVDARRYLANLLGPEVDNPFPELAEGTGIDDFPELPDVERVLAAWRELGEVVAARMAAAGAEQLDAAAPIDFGIEDRSLLGGVAFLLHHESYHVGQLAFLRKLAGLPAMTYDDAG